MKEQELVGGRTKKAHWVLFYIYVTCALQGKEDALPTWRMDPHLSHFRHEHSPCCVQNSTSGFITHIHSVFVLDRWHLMVTRHCCDLVHPLVLSVPGSSA